MPKVFYSMLIRVELIGPKQRPIGVCDGLQVKIPVLSCFARKLQGWTEWEKSFPRNSARSVVGLNSKQVLTSKSVDMFMRAMMT